MGAEQSGGGVPEAPIRAAQTRVRVERVIARLPELAEEHLEGIEENLFELAEVRCRCRRCGTLYRRYLERCPTCLGRP
jgi:rubrerythrin